MLIGLKSCGIYTHFGNGTYISLPQAPSTALPAAAPGCNTALITSNQTLGCRCLNPSPRALTGALFGPLARICPYQRSFSGSLLHILLLSNPYMNQRSSQRRKSILFFQSLLYLKFILPKRFFTHKTRKTYSKSC